MGDVKIPRPDASTDQLRIGRLTKAHGLKGALKVEMYTDDPDKRFAAGAVFTLQVPTTSPWHGRTLTLVELRWYNGQPVAFFEGVTDREGAESLVKAILWIDRDPAEEPEDDAWYDFQLVGLRAMRDGEQIGVVTRIDHFPAQDLLTIRVGDRDVLVPFVAAIVPTVDVAAGTIVLTPPAGLLEELPEDAAETAVDAEGAGLTTRADEPERDEP